MDGGNKAERNEREDAEGDGEEEAEGEILFVKIYSEGEERKEAYILHNMGEGGESANKLSVFFSVGFPHLCTVHCTVGWSEMVLSAINRVCF